MNGWLVFFAVLAILMTVTFFGPRYLVKRAITQVILIFREYHAVDKRNAKTLVDMGLGPISMWQRMMRTRDYKPYALDILGKNEIIIITDDGKVYLSEENLSLSRFADHRR
ncbi:hypothetical protein ACFLUH_00405 [Chloroflexota bacterium]